MTVIATQRSKSLIPETQKYELSRIRRTDNRHFWESNIIGERSYKVANAKYYTTDLENKAEQANVLWHPAQKQRSLLAGCGNCGKKTKSSGKRCTNSVVV